MAQEFEIIRGMNPLDFKIGDEVEITGTEAGNYKCRKAVVMEDQGRANNASGGWHRKVSHCGECDLCKSVGVNRGHTGNVYLTQMVHLFKSGYSKEQLKEMRKTIDKGSLIKIVDSGKVYPDMDEKGAELGSDKEKWFKVAPLVDQEGEVISMDKEGYILMENAQDSQILIDIEGVVRIKKASEIGYLVYFQNSKNLEEFKDIAEVNKRIEELFKAGSVKMDSVIKLYEVRSSKKINLKLEVFLG